MRILVTGAGGQVGLDLLRALRDGGATLHASDVNPAPAGLELEVPWHPLDVTDPAAVDEIVGRLRPDRIFHLAAILSARGESMPQATYAVNQTGTYNVLEAARKHQVAQVMFTSTIAAFGSGVPDPTGDDVPLQPSTMYGVTKVAGELLGTYYHHRYGLDFRGVRFPGLISASLPGGGTSDYALFMYVDGVRKGGYEAFCRADTRIPLMYMPDGIRALLELSAAPRSSLQRCIYNIAGFSPTAAEIAASVNAVIPAARFTFAPDPVRQAILDSWPRALDDAHARDDWGWRAQFDLAAMTADLIPRIEALVRETSTSTTTQEASHHV